jgi:NADH-quinone oxidoreductase subunit E
MTFAPSVELEQELERIVSRYPSPAGACLPVLQACQEAHEGWVSAEVIDYVARRLGMSLAQVEGVVTFYSLLHHRPPGKHQVWVCRTLSCALRGGEELLCRCEQKLGIKCGQTTPDGQITLRSAECLASCGTAPVVRVDREYRENVTPEELDRLLDRLLYEA